MAALGSLTYGKNTYEDIFKELIKSVEEDMIMGIQLYPSGWPRKLQISVADIDTKNRIIIEGLDLFGLHVEFRDDDSVLTKVVVKDAPLDWNNDFITDFMSKYGEIVRVEKEMLYINGRKTNCTTGTRYIFISRLIDVIPTKLAVKVGVKAFTLSVWYRGQNTAEQNTTSCGLCGSDTHDSKSCSHAKKVCFTCHKADHAHKDCPENDGSKRSKEALIFYNSKCPLSNWNTDYPFKVDKKEYICIEQYAMEQKCLIFRDVEAADHVMNETNPKKMRVIGEDIRSYDHREWTKRMYDVVETAVYAKFSDVSARGASEYLLGTGELTLGEATRNRTWGTGIHVSEPLALNPDSWQGRNYMGVILMDVRQKLRSDSEEERTKTDDDKNDSFLEQLRGGDADSSVSSLQPGWAVVIGDSNTTGIPLMDDSVPINVSLCSRGGTTLAHIPDRLSECELTSEQVDVLVLHVGTCEWDFETEVDDGEAVFDRYKDALNVVSTQYARAELVISGVPHRSPTGRIKEKAEEINMQVDALNLKLQELAKIEDNIHFVNNTCNIPIGENLYKDSVHLNDSGRHILAENLKNGIREAYAISALNLDWKAPVTTP